MDRAGKSEALPKADAEALTKKLKDAGADVEMA